MLEKCHQCEHPLSTHVMAANQSSNKIGHSSRSSSIQRSKTTADQWREREREREQDFKYLLTLFFLSGNQ